MYCNEFTVAAIIVLLSGLATILMIEILPARYLLTKGGQAYWDSKTPKFTTLAFHMLNGLGKSLFACVYALVALGIIMFLFSYLKC